MYQPKEKTFSQHIRDKSVPDDPKLRARLIETVDALLAKLKVTQSAFFKGFYIVVVALFTINALISLVGYVQGDRSFLSTAIPIITSVIIVFVHRINTANYKSYTAYRKALTAKK